MEERLRHPGERLRHARERADLTIDEIVERTGINTPSYYDLEAYSDEMTSCISLKDLRKLSYVLQVDPGWLLTGQNTPESARRTFAFLSMKLREHLDRTDLTIEEFGEQIGWEVGPLLTEQDPQKVALDWNVDCLKAVCRAIGENWFAYLPA